MRETKDSAGNIIRKYEIAEEKNNCSEKSIHIQIFKLKQSEYSISLQAVDFLFLSIYEKNLL